MLLINEENDDQSADESDKSDRSEYLAAYERVGISLYDLM